MRNFNPLIHCRCNFCIETALIKITDGILNALDNKSCTSVLMIFDKSSAFNSIDHNILRHRFSCLFDVRSSLLSWYHSNIYNRTQCIIINNHIFGFFRFSSNVPQGSVVAPFLFTLYMKPLSDIFNNYGFNYHLYTDDIQFYFTFGYDSKPDPNKLTACLNVVE